MIKVPMWVSQLWFDICRQFAMYIFRDVEDTRFRYDGGFKKCPLTGDYIRYIVDDHYAIAAGWHRHPFMGLSKDYDNHWTIVSDSIMNNAPLEVREAFRLNRLGHIALNHQPAQVTYTRMELDADEWAVKNGANMLGALKWLEENTLPQMKKHLSLHQHLTRIHALRYGRHSA